jgi:hypothetical protein
MKNKTANKNEYERTYEAKNNLSVCIEGKNHVYDHNPKCKCHNTLEILKC